MKALQLAAAAAAHAAARAAPVGVEFGDDVQRLLQVLATTMAANPLPAVRNAAHYAADALLTSLTVSPPPIDLLDICLMSWLHHTIGWAVL